MIEWNRNQLGQEAALRPLTQYAPACPPGAVAIIDAQGRVSCTQSLPTTFPRPPCDAGTAPVFDARDSSWACWPLQSVKPIDKKIPLPLVIVGGAALIGLVWWAAR